MQLGLEEVNLRSEAADMPLNETDKAWVRDEIRKSLRLTGFAKFTNLLKGWLPLLIGAALVAFVLNEWSGYVQFRTHTGDRLDTIENKDLPDIGKRLEGIQTAIQNLTGEVDLIRLHQLSSDPSDPKNVEEAANLLIKDQANKIGIDPVEIRKIGAKFLEAAENRPANWTPALAFLSYCSFLNAFAAPATPNATPVPYDVEFPFMVLSGAPPNWRSGIRFLASRETVPIGEAAKIEKIGSREHGEFPQEKVGPMYLIMQVGGEAAQVSHLKIGLDHMLLKNAIIRNARLSYEGGPLILSNVFFVDCFFDVARVKPGEKFAKTVVASAATNFEISLTENLHTEGHVAAVKN